jgi:urea transporter
MKTRAFTIRYPFVSLVGQVLIGSLRGIGQVAFVNSALTGIIILIGCSVSSPLTALLGFSSTLMCTAMATLTPEFHLDALNGLHGYNGFLAGMGMGYFNSGLSDNKQDWYFFSILLVPLVFVTILCFFVHLTLLRTLSTPAFTFAYNFSLSCWLAFALGLGVESDFAIVYSTPGSQNPDPIQYSEVDLSWLIKTVLAGVGQVFFSPELTPSIIILVGLAIGSPIAAFLSLLGSLVGTSVAILTHSSRSMTEVGVDGLSAVLCSIAIGGFYFVFSFRSISLAVVSSVFCVAVRYVVAGLLVRLVGPAMTFPFCLVATVVMHATRSLGWPVSVPESHLESPEQHLAAYLDGEISIKRRISELPS